MATLTYNPNDPEAPEFTEQEQQDIQLGEKLQQAEEDQRAGKYQAAEDLENQQIDLTEDEEQPVSEDPEPEETEEEEVVEDDEPVGFTPEDIVTLQNIAGGEKVYRDD